MSTPIDDAISATLSELGGGWFVTSVSVSHFYQIQGRGSRLVGGYDVIIENVDGLTATGSAGTVGNAVAMAMLAVLRQQDKLMAKHG